MKLRLENFFYCSKREIDDLVEKTCFSKVIILALTHLSDLWHFLQKTFERCSRVNLHICKGISRQKVRVNWNTGCLRNNSFYHAIRKSVNSCGCMKLQPKQKSENLHEREKITTVFLANWNILKIMMFKNFVSLKL